MFSCLLQTGHRPGNIRSNPQSVSVYQPPQIIRLPVIPVYLVQILTRPDIILRRTPSVKTALCQIEQAVFAPPVAGIGQQPHGFRIVLNHPFTQKIGFSQYIVTGDAAGGKFLLIALNGIGVPIPSI